MPESAKECDTVLPEGLDIGLGAGDRAFEPRYSDQKPLGIHDLKGLLLFSYGDVSFYLRLFKSPTVKSPIAVLTPQKLSGTNASLFMDSWARTSAS